MPAGTATRVSHVGGAVAASRLTPAKADARHRAAVSIPAIGHRRLRIRYTLQHHRSDRISIDGPRLVASASDNGSTSSGGIAEDSCRIFPCRPASIALTSPMPTIQGSRAHPSGPLPEQL